MHTRLMQADKKVISGLLLVLAANASVAGVDPQVLAQSVTTVPRVKQLGWLGSAYGWAGSLSATVGISPAFRWIETPLVADDPRLQQSSEEKQVLLLSVPVPDGLHLADADVTWEIHPLQGDGGQRLHGRSLSLSLPTGRYEITLLVGSYSERVTVEVTAGQQATPRFAARFGRLRLSSRVEVDWQVRTPDGQTVLERRGNDQINEIVAAGEYDVVANLGSASQTQRVRVASGEVSVASIHLPTGKVSLVATLDNAVAMRPMRWTLYCLDGGRQEIAAPRRHAVVLVLSPGHYEAVANLDGRERRREFTVVSGSNSHVVLAMD